MPTRSHVPILLIALIALVSALTPCRPAASEPPPASPPENAVNPPEAGPRKQGTDLYGDPLPVGAIARMGTVRFRHEQPVNSVAFSPDGKMLAVGGRDKAIRLWEAATGKLIRKLDVSRIRSVSFSPDGKRLASGHDDTTVLVWDVDSFHRDR